MPTSAKPNKLGKVLDESYPKMYFLLNLSHYVKSYGHLCQILAIFMMPALQIWPCHVTQEENFEKILFFPNSAFNIGRSCKISSKKAFNFRSYQPKTSQGVENTQPLSAFRVNKGVAMAVPLVTVYLKLFEIMSYMNVPKVRKFH